MDTTQCSALPLPLVLGWARACSVCGAGAALGTAGIMDWGASRAEAEREVARAVLTAEAMLGAQ